MGPFSLRSLHFSCSDVFLVLRGVGFTRGRFLRIGSFSACGTFCDVRRNFPLAADPQCCSWQSFSLFVFPFLPSHSVPSLAVCFSHFLVSAGLGYCILVALGRFVFSLPSIRENLK